MAHFSDQHLRVVGLCLSSGRFGGEDGDLRGVIVNECRYQIYNVGLHAKSTVSDALRRISGLVLLFSIYWTRVESSTVSRMEIRRRQEGAVDVSIGARYGSLCRVSQFTDVLDSGLLSHLTHVVEEWQTKKT